MLNRTEKSIRNGKLMVTLMQKFHFPKIFRSTQDMPQQKRCPFPVRFGISCVPQSVLVTPLVTNDLLFV